MINNISHRWGHRSFFQQLYWLFIAVLQVIPKFSNLKHCHLTVSVGEESEHGLVWSFWVRVFHKAAIRGSSRAVIISRLEGEEESTSKVVHAVVGRIQFFMGCWMRTSIPCWLWDGGCPQFPSMWTSLEGSWQHGSWISSKRAWEKVTEPERAREKEQDRNHCILYGNLVSDSPSPLLYSIC